MCGEQTALCGNIFLTFSRAFNDRRELFIDIFLFPPFSVPSGENKNAWKRDFSHLLVGKRFPGTFQYWPSGNVIWSRDFSEIFVVLFTRMSFVTFDVCINLFLEFNYKVFSNIVGYFDVLFYIGFLEKHHHYTFTRRFDFSDTYRMFTFFFFLSTVINKKMILISSNIKNHF